jgi:hypothetical protein
MPSMAACSSAHAYRSGLTRTAITGCSCASFSDIGVALRSYKECLSYECIPSPRPRSTERNEKPAVVSGGVPSVLITPYRVSSWLLRSRQSQGFPVVAARPTRTAPICSSARLVLRVMPGVGRRCVHCVIVDVEAVPSTNNARINKCYFIL